MNGHYAVSQLAKASLPRILRSTRPGEEILKRWAARTYSPCSSYAIRASPASSRHYTSIASSSTHTLRVRALRQQRHRSHTALRLPSLQYSTVGAEPGIDSSLKHKPLGDDTPQDIGSEIRVIDYSDQHIEQHDVSGSSFPEFLETHAKPDWASCRWIYVNGLNADIVKTIGRVKKLHRLAIEDVLDTNNSAKVDWYDDHCFLELPLQKLVHRYDREQEPLTPETGIHDHLKRRVLSRHLAISVEQASIFLTSDNTVVTFFEHSGDDVLKPLLTRLEASQTMVRSSNDPWMLVQGVVDTIVDLSLPIGKAVDQTFGELERAVLTAPAIAQSRAVYVLRSGLTLLINNTNSISGLVRTLTDHRDITLPKAPNSMYISAVTQVYLQDVQDHITTLSNNSHMSIRTSENLTSLIFNTIAASQNESVRQLTLVSSFFLPLTFLTGYFGMNFDPMPVVNNHSDAYFWLIATPVMLTTLTFLGIKSRWLKSLIWRRRRRAIESRTR